MKPFHNRTRLSLLACFVIAACSKATQAPPATAPVSTPAPSAAIHLPVTTADIDFMSGMIMHHAQAVLIAGWTVSHGGSTPIRLMTERIVVGQNDEIALMSRWLREHNQPVPEADTGYTHSMGSMPGMEHSMMPGMLSAEQLAQLDSSRGPDFDRLFLTFMLQHHKGAITMVNTLFGSEGAAQDETTFRLASDIYADQTTEINRMQLMLDALPSGEHHP
jgi:uncharacterized protein (DUF305 family)